MGDENERRKEKLLKQSAFPQVYIPAIPQRPLGKGKCGHTEKLGYVLFASS